MQLKKFVEIDIDKCDGCGDCITSCNKGGIKIIEGKAKLVETSFCGSFINCIGECPNGALTIKTKKFNSTILDKEVAPNAGCYFSGRYDVSQWS
ncbi:MAG: ATP-binding protein [Bacillota bacterium]